MDAKLVGANVIPAIGTIKMKNLTVDTFQRFLMKKLN